MDFRQIEDIITRNGWTLVRTLGKSRQYKKSGCERAVILVDHGCRAVAGGVVKNLERSTGLSF